MSTTPTRLPVQALASALDRLTLHLAEAVVALDVLRSSEVVAPAAEQVHPRYAGLGERDLRGELALDVLLVPAAGLPAVAEVVAAVAGTMAREVQVPGRVIPFPPRNGMAAPRQR